MSEKFVPVELVSESEIVARFVDNDLTALHAGKKIFVANTCVAGAQGVAMSVTMQTCSVVKVYGVSASDLLSFASSEERFVVMEKPDRTAWAVFGTDTRQTKAVAGFLEDAFVMLPENGGHSITVTDCARALGLPIIDGAYRYEVNGL